MMRRLYSLVVLAAFVFAGLSTVGCSTSSNKDKMGEKMEDSKMSGKMDDKTGGKMGGKMDDKMRGKMDDKMGGKMEDKK